MHVSGSTYFTARELSGERRPQSKRLGRWRPQDLEELRHAPSSMLMRERLRPLLMLAPGSLVHDLGLRVGGQHVNPIVGALRLAFRFSDSRCLDVLRVLRLRVFLATSRRIRSLPWLPFPWRRRWPKRRRNGRLPRPPFPGGDGGRYNGAAEGLGRGF